MADDPRTGELTTANFGWVKPTVGSSGDAWGGYINTDLDGIDSTVHSIQTSVPVASSTTPAMDGTATIGTGTTFARADHIHPSDTSRLSLTGGTLTGALTPSQTAGIVGTTAANNVNAGAVGEYVAADKLTNVSLTTSVAKTVISISLTAGDWDVEGAGWFAASAGATAASASISPTNNALNPVSSYLGTATISFSSASLDGMQLPTGPLRVSQAVTATWYLVMSVAFTSGTCSAQGSIAARRVR